MKQQLETIRDSALQELAETKTQAELESLRVKYLRKKRRAHSNPQTNG